MNPDEWLVEGKHICSDSNWDAFSRLRTKTNQAFASSFDFEGLANFYEELIDSSLDEAKLTKVRIKDIGAFQSGVALAFQTAQSKLPDMPKVKGVYFEYFYDGGDSCTGNVYLCEAYSDDDDDGGAEYYSLDAMVIGPNVAEYFDFDRDLEWDPYLRYVAEEYVNGRLLGAVLEEWATSGITGLPFGFANHDHEMVRAPANEQIA